MVADPIEDPKVQDAFDEAEPDMVEVEPSPEEMWGIDGLGNKPEDTSYHYADMPPVLRRRAPPARVVGGAWADYIV